MANNAFLGTTGLTAGNADKTFSVYEFSLSWPDVFVQGTDSQPKKTRTVAVSDAISHVLLGAVS